MKDRPDASKTRETPDVDDANAANDVAKRDADAHAVPYESDRYKRADSPRPPAKPQHSTLPPPQSVVNEKYRIDAELGRGGMGAVYRAHHVELLKPVALKWLLPELATDQDSRQRFGREARAASNIKHENVVDVYDFGIDAERGVPYIVMELLTGVSLSAHLEQRKHLNVRDTLDIMIQCMRGVAAAHKLGIVHRDLKPENIFLCEGDEPDTYRVKVLDFGVAAALEAKSDEPLKQIITRTASRNVVGTVFYMSAEQLAGGALDARADVYSIGVIFYELLSGKPPYVGPTLNDLATAILDGNAPPLATVVHGLDPALSQLVQRAMASRKADRFADMNEAIQAFQQYRKQLRSRSMRESRRVALQPVKMSGETALARARRAVTEVVQPLGARLRSALVTASASTRRLGAGMLALLGGIAAALAQQWAKAMRLSASVGAKTRTVLARVNARVWLGAGGLALVSGLLAWGLTLRSGESAGSTIGAPQPALPEARLRPDEPDPVTVVESPPENSTSAARDPAADPPAPPKTTDAKTTEGQAETVTPPAKQQQGVVDPASPSSASAVSAPNVEGPSKPERTPTFVRSSQPPKRKRTPADRSRGQSGETDSAATTAPSEPPAPTVPAKKPEVHPRPTPSQSGPRKPDYGTRWQ